MRPDDLSAGQLGRARRAWYRPHASTVGLAAALALLVGVLEVRGFEAAHARTLMGRVDGPPLSVLDRFLALIGRETGCLFPPYVDNDGSVNLHQFTWRHGLPFAYLRRESGYRDGLATPRASPWALAVGVASFDPLALGADALLAVAVWAAAVVAFECRKRA